MTSEETRWRDDSSTGRILRFEGGRTIQANSFDLATLEAEVISLRKQLEEVLLKDRGKTNEINILTRENRELRQQLEAAREQVWTYVAARKAAHEAERLRSQSDGKDKDAYWALLQVRDDAWEVWHKEWAALSASEGEDVETGGQS